MFGEGEGWRIGHWWRVESSDMVRDATLTHCFLAFRTLTLIMIPRNYFRTKLASEAILNPGVGFGFGMLHEFP